jgi:6-phosphogluconolactonase
MRFFLLCLLTCATCSGFSQHYYLFVGTYTANGKSAGIYVYDFNLASGRAVLLDSAVSKNPSYLAISSNGRFIYAVNENGADQNGEVSAFSFNKSSGRLHFLNKQSSGGADPCYIAENHQGNWVVVANYNGGSLVAIPVRPDGRIDSVAEKIQHVGSGPNKDRQEKAHVHSVVFSADERFLFAADLGTDQETIYQFNPAKSRPITAAQDSAVHTAPGSGPRHFIFHPQKPYAYLIEELSGTIDAYYYQNGKLTHVQHISTHPAAFKGVKGSADIHITPNGKFLYASNRGDANSLAIFSIDSATGELQLRGLQSVLGLTPRNFMIDPTGKFLLVGDQGSDRIVVFTIDPKSGILKPTGFHLDVPSPVCLKMLKK